MSQVFVVRPGATPFDEQGRFKGCLDLPLSDKGREQVAQVVEALCTMAIDRIYVAPCTAARQTGDALAQPRGLSVVEVRALRNIDHGLWHGKLIDEVRRQQPRLYRWWQDDPEQFHPPQGETWLEARQRVARALPNLCLTGGQGVCLVVPEPMASLIDQMLGNSLPMDLWKIECRCGHWSVWDVSMYRAVATR